MKRKQTQGRKERKARKSGVAIPAIPELDEHADAIRRIGKQTFEGAVENCVPGRHRRTREMVMTNDELLDIDALLALPEPVNNIKRHRRAMALYSAARNERRGGNYELADRLKHAGLRLQYRNFEIARRPAGPYVKIGITGPVKKKRR